MDNSAQKCRHRHAGRSEPLITRLTWYGMPLGRGRIVRCQPTPWALARSPPGKAGGAKTSRACQRSTEADLARIK